MLNKKIFFIISVLILTYISNEIYIKLYEWNDPQNCFKKEYIETIGYAGECKGKLIVNNEILRELVNEEYKGDKIKEYGFLFKFITNYDDDNIFTGQVTDMSKLFLRKKIKYDIEDWNTLNVTNMNSMFAMRLPNEGYFPEDYFEIEKLKYKNEIKKDNIGKWNVSNVTDMSYMFYYRKFNKQLDKWNVSNVKNMSGMFADAIAFNQPLNNWNVSNVNNMRYMFDGAIEFNQPLNNWNVSNVEDMIYMFSDARNFNQPLNHWNVSNVKDMSYMFSNANNFNQFINNWNVSSVTNMSGMFSNANNFNQPLDQWNVSNVIDMSYMFKNSKKFNQPLNKWKNKNLRKDDFKNSAIEEKNLPELNDEKR